MKCGAGGSLLCNTGGPAPCSVTPRGLRVGAGGRQAQQRGRMCILLRPICIVA